MKEDEIQDNLKNIRTKSEKINAIKARITARRDAMGQKVDDVSLFKFSSRVGGKSKIHDLEKLKHNLVTLIQLSKGEMADLDFIENIKLQPANLVGKMLRHCWDVSGKDVTYMCVCVFMHTYMNNTYVNNLVSHRL